MIKKNILQKKFSFFLSNHPMLKKLKKKKKKSISSTIPPPSLSLSSFSDRKKDDSLKSKIKSGGLE